MFTLYLLIFNCFLAVFLTILKVRVLYYRDLKIKSMALCSNIKSISFFRPLVFSRLNKASKKLTDVLLKLKSL